MRESETYQMILEEGEVKGLEKGRLAEIRDMVLRLGTKKFGDPTRGSAANLNTVDDRERLERMLERVSEVSDWAELLKTP